jgi:hypothetical protein
VVHVLRSGYLFIYTWMFRYTTSFSGTCSFKGIQSLRLFWFFYIESCQYSMFYTNCSWNFSEFHTYLTWNKGNMSLFDFLTSRKEFNVYQHDIHIFMNIIISPLMTYTVTSFGKAFAHVRNCLLKKATSFFIFLQILLNRHVSFSHRIRQYFYL